MGFLVDFLSHAAIVGFVAGAAIVIGLQQLKGLLGISHFTTKTDIISVIKAVWGAFHHPVYYYIFLIHWLPFFPSRLRKVGFDGTQVDLAKKFHYHDIYFSKNCYILHIIYSYHSFSKIKSNQTACFIFSTILSKFVTWTQIYIYIYI